MRVIIPSWVGRKGASLVVMVNEGVCVCVCTSMCLFCSLFSPVRLNEQTAVSFNKTEKISGISPKENSGKFCSLIVTLA